MKIKKPFKLPTISLTVVISISAIILCAAFLFYKVSRKEQTVYVDLTYPTPNWSEKPLPQEYMETNELKKNDCVYGSSGKAVACITNIRTIDWGENRRMIDITVSVSAYFDPRTKTFVYQARPLLIGGLMTLEFPKVSFPGKIVNVYQKVEDRYAHYEQKKALITVLLRYIEPAYAKALETFEAKDSNGNLIAKTVSIQTTPAEIEIKSDTGVVYKGYSQIFVDTRVTLQADAILCASGTCYFNDAIGLKIGSQDFFVHSDKTFIQGGVVTDITYQ